MKFPGKLSPYSYAHTNITYTHRRVYRVCGGATKTAITRGIRRAVSLWALHHKAYHTNDRNTGGHLQGIARYHARARGDPGPISRARLRRRRCSARNFCWAASFTLFGGCACAVLGARENNRTNSSNCQ